MDHLSHVIIQGRFHFKVKRQGEIVHEGSVNNRVCVEGLNAFWATAIGSTPAGGLSWYCGILRYLIVTGKRP